MSENARPTQDPSSDAVTSLLAKLSEGNQDAVKQLVPLIYEELHRLAAHYMRGERQGHTLQTSALVNEAYIRLAGVHNIDWKNRGHFLGTAASVMRHVLVDHARSRDAQKRGGAETKIPLDEALICQNEDWWQVIEIHDALTRLEQYDPRQCRIVELRIFAGLDVEETAAVLALSPRTIKREFRMAKAWLHGELSKKAGGTTA